MDSELIASLKSNADVFTRKNFFEPQEEDFLIIQNAFMRGAEIAMRS